MAIAMMRYRQAVQHLKTLTSISPCQTNAEVRTLVAPMAAPLCRAAVSAPKLGRSLSTHLMAFDEVPHELQAARAAHGGASV